MSPPHITVDRPQDIYFNCAGCGRLFSGVDVIICGDQSPEAILCEPCYRLRHQIEDRIIEICSCPGGLPTEKVREDLARFGVDQDLVDAAMQRMYADGRLVEAGA